MEEKKTPAPLLNYQIVRGFAKEKDAPTAAKSPAPDLTDTGPDELLGYGG